MEKSTGKPSLLGMFWSPSEQFERIRHQPRIWLPLAIVTLIYTVASVIMATMMKAEDLVVPGALTLEDAEAFLGFTKITTVVSGIVGTIIGILVSSVIYLIIVKIAKKDTTFKQLFSMTTYIMVISATGMLLNSLLQTMLDGKPGIQITSLAGVMNSDSLVLAQFEVFSIWGLILTAIGLHKVGQLSKGASWAIAIVFFLIGLGFAMIGTAFEGITGL
ncbi:Yip1 family protein [Robertmurraya andreesenii]|uniref:Yip1 domain-containing protein n=1 Tax=Anoxybacillus andreesenii TaxID=1325932 RepID=A0ABT9V8P9_9BACL|nr:Yip1 family protein [Robertmurraya andreesenii]MDQ0157321.1 hypothetical protein [Robertmurraya andreesenii]